MNTIAAATAVTAISAIINLTGIIVDIDIKVMCDHDLDE